MDDSDDYFDDIAFTEKDFESIDAEATRCLSATQQTPIPPEARNTPPPAKRQQTTHTWNKPGNGTEPPGSTDEFEVMPEILVQGDGSYAFYGSRGRPSRGVSGRPGTSHPPVRPLSATSSVQSVQSVKPVHSNQPRPQSLSRRPSGGSGVITQRRFSPIPPQVHRTAVVPLSRRPSGAQPLHRVDSNQEKVIQALQTELTNLRAHVDEVQFMYSLSRRDVNH